MQEYKDLYFSSSFPLLKVVLEDLKKKELNKLINASDIDEMREKRAVYKYLDSLPSLIKAGI